MSGAGAEGRHPTAPSAAPLNTHIPLEELPPSFRGVAVALITHGDTASFEVMQTITRLLWDGLKDKRRLQLESELQAVSALVHEYARSASGFRGRWVAGPQAGGMHGADDLLTGMGWPGLVLRTNTRLRKFNKRNNIDNRNLPAARALRNPFAALMRSERIMQSRRSAELTRERVRLMSSSAIPVSASGTPEATGSASSTQPVDHLSARLAERCEELLPTKANLEERAEVLARLQRRLQEKWPGAFLETYGSTGSGLAFRNADIDIHLGGLESSAEDEMDAAAQRSRLVREVANHLGMCVDAKGNKEFVSIEPVANARVPICIVRDAKTGVECDLAVGNYLGVQNTQLLRAYVDFDPRAAQLMTLVKYWAKQKHLAKARSGGLSSYTWSIMAIFFLQHTRPPVLPNFQAPELVGTRWQAPLITRHGPSSRAASRQLREVQNAGGTVSSAATAEGTATSSVTEGRKDDEGEGDGDGDGEDDDDNDDDDGADGSPSDDRTLYDVSFCRDPEEARAWLVKSSQGMNNSSLSLGQLFLDFFRFYAFEFSASKFQIAINVGEYVPRSKFAKGRANKPWRPCVRDPFEPERDLADQIKNVQVQLLIEKEMRRAVSSLLDDGAGQPGGPSLQDSVLSESHVINKFMNYGKFQRTCRRCGAPGHEAAKCELGSPQEVNRELERRRAMTNRSFVAPVARPAAKMHGAPRGASGIVAPQAAMYGAPRGPSGGNQRGRGRGVSGNFSPARGRGRGRGRGVSPVRGRVPSRGAGPRGRPHAAP